MGVAMAVNPIPEGFHTVTPYLSTPDASALVAFLQRAFDARELQRHTMPNGRIINAQVQVGDSMVLIADGPPDRKPHPAVFYMYVADVDARYEQAVQAGGVSIEAPCDQFYGDRVGAVQDPAGNHWYIASHREDMSEEELVRRAAQKRG